MEEEEGGGGEGGIGTDGRDGRWCRGGDSGRVAGRGGLKFRFFSCVLGKQTTHMLLC